MHAGPTQLLQPAAKKLTLIDARRVLSIYDESVRRVQLVSGLLEQTSIATIVDRLSTLLGAELVDALCRYTNVLDVFDEVVSWREMTISGTRTPVVRSELDVGRGDALAKDDSIFAMLFKQDEEPPPVMSSYVLMRSNTTFYT